MGCFQSTAVGPGGGGPYESGVSIARGDDSEAGGCDETAWRGDLMAGTLDEATLERLHRPPMMSLFVASTVLDSWPEREHWRLQLWPRVAALCEQRGMAFELADLRWGVNEKMMRLHDAPELCQAEVARCCERSANGAAAFLLLATESYGWRALPRRVPAAELAKIMAGMPTESPARSVVESW